MKTLLLLLLLALCFSLMAFSCHYQGENHLETAKEVKDVPNTATR